MANISKIETVLYTISNITASELTVLMKVLAGVDLASDETKIADQLLANINSMIKD